MAVTRWNDREDELLQYLPHRAQVLYLRGLRRWMDYSTGVVGVSRGISIQQLVELLEVGAEYTGRNREERVTARQVRTMIEQLERVGLVERLEGRRISSLVTTLVFRLPWADMDSSVQNNGVTATSQRRHTSGVTIEPSIGAACEGGGVTAASQRRHTSGVTPPVSDIRLQIDTSSPSTTSIQGRGDDDLNIADPPTQVDHWVRWFSVRHGVAVSAMNRRDRKIFWPLATRWCSIGITLGQMQEAIEMAHKTATEAISYLPAYADRVLASMQAPAKSGRPEWSRLPVMDDQLCGWAKRNGYPMARPGATMSQYREQLRAAVDGRLQEEMPM